MTREETIDGLYEIKNWKCDGDSKMHEVIVNAIELLKQEPCEDAISRQAVLDCLTASGLKKFDFILDARDKIKKLPPVNPQQRWIPVSERLPKKSDRYWCTFGGTYYMGIDSYCTKEDAEEIYEEPEECVGWASQNVIAWMPLPEPYKAGGEG